MNNLEIFVCADDYGMSEECNRVIEQCAIDGAVNKISIFPNMGFSECKSDFGNKKVQLSLHLNLVEGKSLTNFKKLGLLVSEDGYFKHSFVGLLLLSMSHKRKKLKQQLYDEIREQVLLWKNLYGDKKMWVDSHQHTHMIPLVFKALLSVLKDEGVDVEYIRFPAECILPYLAEPSLYLTYSPVNIIKQWLLKFLGMFNKSVLETSGIKTAYFMGILFSGNMDEKRVKRILPHYIKLAKKRNKNIEVLFHPGYGQQSEGDSKCKFDKFYCSKGRKTEFDAVMNLNTYERRV